MILRFTLSSQGEKGEHVGEKSMDLNGNLCSGQAFKVIQDDPKGFERILAYLMYEKSIISFDDDGKRVNYYLDMVRDLSKGYHVSMTGNFEKMVAIVFELVFSRKIDPWNIDLISFGREYIARLEREKDINLITIGKVVFMAWGVLAEKSEIILEEAIKSQEEEMDNPMYGDAEYPYDGLDDRFDNALAPRDEAPITEMVWRDASRTATLLDIVEALADAEKEAAVRKIIEDNRLRLREENKKAESEINVFENSHKDNIEEDMAIVWAKINQYNGSPIRLTKLCDYHDRMDVITTLISTVHLAHRKKISLWQKNFPYGDIYVRNLMRKHSN